MGWSLLPMWCATAEGPGTSQSNCLFELEQAPIAAASAFAPGDSGKGRGGLGRGEDGEATVTASYPVGVLWLWEFLRLIFFFSVPSFLTSFVLQRAPTPDFDKLAFFAGSTTKEISSPFLSETQVTLKTQGCFFVSGAGDGSERARGAGQTSARGWGCIALALPVIWFLLQQRIPCRTECAELLLYGIPLPS